ncbi:EscN/YscN/HrcN family type III secretion system ATPase, partial [Helicobacter pylori]
LLKENEMLIRIGSYQMGNDKELDEAIKKKALMEQFLVQDENALQPFEQSFQQLEEILR